MIYRKLENSLQGLKPFTEQGKTTGPNDKDAEALTGLLDGIRDAMLDY